MFVSSIIDALRITYNVVIKILSYFVKNSKHRCSDNHLSSKHSHKSTANEVPSSKTSELNTEMFNLKT